MRTWCLFEDDIRRCWTDDDEDDDNDDDDDNVKCRKKHDRKLAHRRCNVIKCLRLRLPSHADGPRRFQSRSKSKSKIQNPIGSEMNDAIAS